MPNPDIKKIINECYRRGFIVKQGMNMHWKVYLPNGKMVVISSTPGGSPAINKIKADFKRNGYPI